jgi:MATE family multidrug resistance protein
MGTTGLVARAKGAGDGAEVAALPSRALLVGGACGLALILLQSLIFAAGLWLSPASGEVEGLAKGYFAFRIWSAPATVAVFGINGWLIGAGATRALLALQLG